jgi:glycosyltransferase involved in cell wall biosynthesis
VSRSTPPRVLLLRGLEDPARPSMRRFGVEFEHALRASETALVENSVVLAPLGVGRVDPYLARYVREPLAVARRRHTAAIFHLMDHSLGHLAALTPPARTVITCHDLMLLRASEGTAGFRARPWSTVRFAWSTSFARRVARVVCTTEAMKADVVRLRAVPPERVSVVPNGVGDQFRPLGAAVRERVRAALGISGPVILHVCSGQPYKNVSATLRVLAAVRSAEIDARLVRVGAPLTRAERALCSELRVDRAVLELGVVPEARLVEIYNAADVLIFPSFAEGFGWPPLEAMACGTPVVTSEDPAIVEVVGDAGLHADARDVTGLAGAIRSLLSDPELARRMRALGRDRAAGFSWAATAKGYGAVYETLAQGEF